MDFDKRGRLFNGFGQQGLDYLMDSDNRDKTI